MKLEWIVACSGGPDSMALLDMMKDKPIGVAHVNYHKRDSAKRDMEIVENYCALHGIPCFVLNEPYEVVGNFQAFARDYRYEFFKRVVEATSAQGVLLAHQEDDVLETYLMQQKKGLIPDYFGLREMTEIKGVVCKRPLLSYSKQSLMEYCDSHNVPYGIDESNLRDDYTRNQIRHSIVEKMSENERATKLQEIKGKNAELLQQRERVRECAHQKQLNLKEYFQFDVEDRLVLLRMFLRYHEVHTMDHASKKQLAEIDKALSSEKHVRIPLGEFYLNKAYELCEIVVNEDKSYYFILESLHSLATEFFKVTFEGNSLQAVTVSEDDFPLVIRSPRENDKIEMRFGHKAINRFFIDRKIPLEKRKVWPIVLNKDNEVILVPGLGCNVNHYSIKPNLFVVQ
ncbi:MAG: tRNA lysidine(34) synthetase TilS [Erysipelotrichaceae bacterium]|nr:tRNA lysidine(34) synthetase TilS [Erysipelotrichaceae bacterium]